MSITKVKKELLKLYGNKVSLVEDEYSYILSGELDNYEDILKACSMAVNKKSGKHVVNNIVLKNKIEEHIHYSGIEDKALDNKEVDVLVIGGGISGCSILRELSKWNIKALLIDKEADVANGASSRNDGEIHPGVDLAKGSLKQKYVVKGNRMYDKVASELGVDFKRIGQYACFKEWYLRPIIWLYALQRKYVCKVDDTKFVRGKYLRSHLPHLAKDVKYAIYNPMAGVISPYELTIAYAENAITNGAEISLNTLCKEMLVENNKITKVITNRGTIYPKVVINAAGVYADNIAKMANDQFYSIHPRKGTIIISDKKENFITDCISSVKRMSGEAKHTKGGGILRTTHDNLLIGPDAKETYFKEDNSTDSNSINKIYNDKKDTFPELNARETINYFSGTRAATFEEDFVICKGKRTTNLVHCAGIQSPGLTTAPAVALDVEKMAIELLGDVKENPNYNPIRKRPIVMNKLSDEEKDKVIKDNPDYGVIVCRCEQISKGEIIEAMERPLKVASIDGIRRRVRPGMGRCQGSFCMPVVASIIASHEHIEIKDVVKQNANSFIGYSNTKEGVKYE